MARLAAIIAEVLLQELDDPIEAQKVMEAVEQVVCTHSVSAPSQSVEITACPIDKPVEQPVEQKETWSQILSKPAKSEVEFHEPVMVEGKRVVHLPLQIYEEGEQRWQNALVGQIIGQSINLGKIYATVNYLWGRKGRITLNELDDGLILFDVPSAEVRDWILKRGPWHIHNAPILLRPWKNDLGVVDIEKQSIPVWVKLTGLPLQLQTPSALSYIASGIGVPVSLEKTIQNVAKASEAKVRVEISIEDDMPHTIPVVLENGVSSDVGVVYPWKKKPKSVKKPIEAKKWVEKIVQAPDESSSLQHVAQQAVASVVLEPVSSSKTDKPMHSELTVGGVKFQGSKSTQTVKTVLKTSNKFLPLDEGAHKPAVSPRKSRAAAQGVNILLQQIKQGKRGARKLEESEVVKVIDSTSSSSHG